MMMIRILFCFLFFFPISCSSQSDTIYLKKNRTITYKCHTENALSWYLQIKNDVCVLVDLKIDLEEVQSWFLKFSSSQNIYKAAFQENNSKKIYFSKPNDPLDSLVLNIIYFDLNQIILEIPNTSEHFVFRKIN